MPRVLDLLREIGHAMKMSEIEFCASCKIYLSAHFHVQFPDIEDSWSAGSDEDLTSSDEGCSQTFQFQAPSCPVWILLEGWHSAFHPHWGLWMLYACPAPKNCGFSSELKGTVFVDLIV